MVSACLPPSMPASPLLRETRSIFGKVKQLDQNVNKTQYNFCLKTYIIEDEKR